MRKILIAAVGVIALAALPTMALAGVVASVHDIPDFMNYTGTAAKMGTCSFCHIPHKANAGGEKLFPETYTLGLPIQWSTDRLSNICWYCHGAASGLLSAREVNPFQGTSHLRNTTLLTTKINTAGATNEPDIASVPTDMTLTGTQLRCVSCHAIHDNAKRPFLRWGTSGDFSAAAATGFCGKCHPNRNSTVVGASNPGMHPARNTYADSGVNTPLNGVTVAPAVFQINMSTLTDPLVGGWDLGGHLLYTGVTEGTTFLCGTCHTVHANETTNFAAADATTQVVAAITTPGNDLVLAKAITDTTTDLIEDICEGCHSIVPGAGTRGPGAAGTFSHPTGTDTAWGESMRLAGDGYIWNTSTAIGSTIICQSCHDMHFSNLNHGTSATGSYLQAFQCVECHVSGMGPGVHHVTDIAGANTLVNGTATTSTATDWANRGQTKTAFNYWAASTTMTCKTCHGTSHNKPATGGGLTVGVHTESDMCVDCHSFNPSVYTNTTTIGTATHFVGGITDTAYKVTTTLVAGYANNAPRYSPDSVNGSVICESCHTVQINGVNGHVVSYQFSNNVGDGLASTADSVRNVLLVSGNSDSFTTAAQNLCTACHGATPGGGQSHPVLPNYTGTSTMVPTSNGQATTTAGVAAVGQLNCESCHRPHDADTDSNTVGGWTNAWILEAAANPGTYIDYSPLCDNCHPAQY